MVTPMARRGAVTWIRDRFGLSERRACTLAEASRSMVRYRSQRDDGDLRRRLLELAAQRPRFGYRRLHVLLRREGWVVNRKRVYRLYRSEGLAVRRKKRKRVAQASRQPRTVPTRANEQWSMDFMSDSLADGRQYRTLNIVDDATRECLAIEVDTCPGQKLGSSIFTQQPSRIRGVGRQELASRRLGIFGESSCRRSLLQTSACSMMEQALLVLSSSVGELRCNG